MFIWENFHPGRRDLGNRAGPPSEYVEMFTKEIGMRRDLGNGAGLSRLFRPLHGSKGFTFLEENNCGPLLRVSKLRKK